MKIAPICNNFYNPKILHQNNCVQKLNYNAYDIFFKGSIHKRIRNLQTLDDGSTIELKKSQTLKIPKNGLTIEYSKENKIDFGTYKIRKMLSEIKEGEECFLTKRDFENKHSLIPKNILKVYRKNGEIFIQNISTTNLKATKDACYKNYNKEYLKETYSNNPLFENLINSKYSQIRHADYSSAETFPLGVEKYNYDLSRLSTKGIELYTNDFWIFKFFKNKNYDCNCVDRMSLNVQADVRLLQELDMFFRFGVYFDKQNQRKICSDVQNMSISYKIPITLNQWLNRVDPITIYSEEYLTDEIVDIVANISEKYKRTEEGEIPLIGAIKNKPWIAHEKEPTEEDFIKFINKAKKVSKIFTKKACRYCYENYDKENGFYRFNASPGMVLACRATFDEYQEYLYYLENNML